LFVPTHCIRRLAGGAGLFAAAWLITASTETTAADTVALPANVTQKVISADIAFLQKGLSKMPQKREVPTLKAVAMLLALQGQNHLSEPKMAALRDQALKVGAAIAQKNYTAAKAEAAKLASPPTATSKGPLILAEQNKFDLAELMSMFRNDRVGGLNIEKDLRAQAKKVSDVDLAGVIGGRSATAAEYAIQLPPSDAVGAKKKQWDDWCNEMKKLGEEIAAEAGKGASADKAALAKKLAALDANCTACHNVFRQ
jgi:cytochrome c556